MREGQLSFHLVEDGETVLRLYPLIVQLRPLLASPEDWLSRWRRQAEEGYRLISLHEGHEAIGLAGFRVQENLVHGRFLYVDDLVTDTKIRGQGHGERLIQHLFQHAASVGCTKLLLDTPMVNLPAQRFYRRCGLLATALRFSCSLEQNWNRE